MAPVTIHLQHQSLCMNSTRTQQDSRQITIHPQNQLLLMNSISEKQRDMSLFMNSISQYSSTVPDTIIQSYCLLSMEKVFTCSKSIPLSGFSSIKTEYSKLLSAYKRKLKSQSSAGLISAKIPPSGSLVLENYFTTITTSSVL